MPALDQRDCGARRDIPRHERESAPAARLEEQTEPAQVAAARAERGEPGERAQLKPELTGGAGELLRELEPVGILAGPRAQELGKRSQARARATALNAEAGEVAHARGVAGVQIRRDPPRFRLDLEAWRTEPDRDRVDECRELRERSVGTQGKQVREVEQPRDRDERRRSARLPKASHELERRALVLSAREPDQSLQVTCERPHMVALVAEALRFARESFGGLELAADRLLLSKDEDVLQSAKPDMASLRDVRPTGRVHREGERAPRETAEPAL